MSLQTKLTIIAFTLLISTVTLSNVHAWIEPSTIPPGNNIFAPLNSSSFGQSKVGGLILNLGGAVYGLIVKSGLVGIGTDEPESMLDVRGETRTDSLGVRGSANIGGKLTSTGLGVNSTTEGALLPRMTTAQRDAIASKTEGLLIYNITSKQLEIYSDGAWKASSGGGDSLPKGTIAFFNLSSCPSGWAEKTELKGRYPVGLPNSGTLGQSVGTALTNGEDRAVGQHSHGVTDPGHSHSIRPNGGDTRYSGNTWSYGDANWGTGPYVTSANSTNISIQNFGSVAGTNAPYLQLLACEKLTTGSSGDSTTTGGNYWQNNGTNIYYNDGNVGVGTSAPTKKFQVMGDAEITGNICINGDCKAAWPIPDICPQGYSKVWRQLTSSGFYICMEPNAEVSCSYNQNWLYYFVAAKYINSEKYTRAYVSAGYGQYVCDTGYIKDKSATCTLNYLGSLYKSSAVWTNIEPGGVSGNLQSAENVWTPFYPMSSAWSCSKEFLQ